MKKKIALFVSLAVLVVIAVAGISVYKYHRLLEVKSFNITDYQYEIDEYVEYADSEFPRFLEPIPDAETLRAVAQKLWLEIYGDEMIKDEKPYLVFYDEASDAWLVRGYHEKPSFLLTGGVSYLIVQSDGKVLSIWHDRD